MNIQTIEFKTGLTKRMIRHYEDLGLISPNRGCNNYRNYNSNDVDKLICIKALRNIGFSLDDIKIILTDGGTENVLRRHLRNLLLQQQENYQQQKQNAQTIKQLLNLKDCESTTLLDQIVNAQSSVADIDNQHSISKFFDREHIVRGHIPAVDNLAKVAKFGPDNDHKIIDITYITYKGVFEENTFTRASISMCREIYSYIILFTDSDKKYSEKFHKKILEQFVQQWESVSHMLSCKFQAIGDDMVVLENLFSPFDLALQLTAENSKKERFQIIIPGQPLVVYLSLKQNTRHNDETWWLDEIK